MRVVSCSEVSSSFEVTLITMFAFEAYFDFLTILRHNDTMFNIKQIPYNSNGYTGFLFWLVDYLCVLFDLLENDSN